MRELETNDYVLIEIVGLIMYIDKNRASATHTDVDEELMSSLRKSLLFKKGQFNLATISELIQQGLINFCFKGKSAVANQTAFKLTDLDLDFLENVLFFVGDQKLIMSIAMSENTKDIEIDDILLSTLVKLAKEDRIIS